MGSGSEIGDQGQVLPFDLLQDRGGKTQDLTPSEQSGTRTIC